MFQIALRSAHEMRRGEPYVSARDAAVAVRDAIGVLAAECDGTIAAGRPRANRMYHSAQMMFGTQHSHATIA